MFAKRKEIMTNEIPVFNLAINQGEAVIKIKADKTVENFQDIPSKNQISSLMKLLTKIPEVKNSVVEAKSKLLIHQAPDKEDIVILLSYPKFEN